MRIVIAVVLLLSSSSLVAQTRTYAGGFSSRWKTIGLHGHDQPMCAPDRIIELDPGSFIVNSPDCNALDFARGNLDNSIGYRGGAERRLFALGPLQLVGGVEGAASHTEYNLTQADFTFATAALTGGLDLAWRGFGIGGRFGAGPFITSDRNEAGLHAYREGFVTLPLRPGAGLRVSVRNIGVFDHSSNAAPRQTRAVETSILLVASPEFQSESGWEFSTATGSTRPGGRVGSSRGLRSTDYNQLTASHALPWRDLTAELSWTSTAHESIQPTVFRGYPGNFRSKTIDGIGLAISRTRPLRGRFSLRYAGGIEVADWRDEHQLLTRDGNELVAGIEVAAHTSAAVRYQITPLVAFEYGLQKVYWHSISLGEARQSFGLVITRSR